MNRCKWMFAVPFLAVACAEDEGSGSQATTLSPDANSSTTSSASGGASGMSTGSGPATTTSSAAGAPASPDPSERPGELEPEPASEPDPNVGAEPEPEPVRPRPSFGPMSPESEPAVSPRGGSGGRDGTAGGTSGPGGNGGASTGGTGGAAGAPTEPEPMEGCESGPLDAPIEGCSPEFEETGDFYEDCVARINQLRWECQCLPPLERWVEGEDCADQHAQYDYEQDEAHAGIRAGICEEGNASQNECPDYNPNFDVINFCLQQMWDEGPGEDFQRHGHYINMSSTTVGKVACGLYVTPEGNFWSVQNFTR